MSSPRIGGSGPVSTPPPTAPNNANNVNVGGLDCQCESVEGLAVLSHGDNNAELARTWRDIIAAADSGARGLMAR